ncbi:ribonuclease R [Patescibacteria group bacterium]|jgi:ribonuclease R|nr:ribonuclease R [Patescibacteria group bacterium]
MSHKKHGPKQSKNHTELEGRISLNTRGKGYFRLDGEERDAEIPAEATNTALHGDMVKIALGPKRTHFPRTAEVLEVVERAKTHFVGTLIEEDGLWYLDPDDRKVYVNFLLRPKDQDRAKKNYKALVELTRWSDPKKVPEVTLIEVIGKKGEHETEMRSSVLAQGFDYTFPAEVEAAAEALSDSRAETFARAEQTHRDLRDRPTFTIDPHDAKDFDDAISVVTHADGTIELGVHIADVSTYVPEGSAIDVEAHKRATSIYLVDRTIPMLPEVLSNDLCSLKPEEDRLAFTALFTFSPEHALTDTWFGQSIIRSDRRFAYEEAQEILEAEEGELAQELVLARDVARTLRKERFKDGAIAFETEEIKFTLDEDMKPVEVIRKHRQEANLLIEDLMLLANRAVAERVSRECKARGGPCTFPYRIHDKPDPEKIIDLATFVEAMGFDLTHRHGEVTGKDLNALFTKIEGTEAQEIIETTAIRSMAKAIYSLKNIGHFGLGFTHYTHFTSPIRRYPDLLVHRVLAQVLAGEGTPQQAYSQYERMLTHATEREISATEAERDSVKYKQVEYLAPKVGETFEGRVTGITDFGIFVEELYSKAEGLIRLRDLSDDYYNLDEHGVRLVGERTGRTISLCDHLNVKLIGVDLEHKMVDWKMVA